MSGREEPPTQIDLMRQFTELNARRLFHEVEASSGFCIVAAMIDGQLQDVSTFLVERLGPAVAYERLQKTCDAIARRVADERHAREN